VARQGYRGNRLRQEIRQPPGVAYVYTPDRKAERPIVHLEGFKGTLQVDAYESLAYSLLPDGATFVGAPATDVFLDGVEHSDMFERFAGDRRRTGSCKLIEATPYCDQ
jgi:hypothetical protein